MTTLADKWNQFQVDVLPPDLSVEDAQLLRGAFYAGASSVVLLINDHEDDTKVLGGIYRDIHNFALEAVGAVPGTH